MTQCQHHQKCQSSAIAAAEQYCQQHDLRFTPLRRRVLEIIWGNHEPTKAYDILALLDNTAAIAKPPTVYRTLDFLQQYGLVHKLNSMNAYVGCAHPNKHQNCYFLICDQCGDVAECCHQKVDALIAEISQNFSFTHQQTTLEIQGICSTCTQL